MSFLSKLNNELIDFITNQHIFFTGTSPLEGRINISPKGMDSFRSFDSKTVGYLDVTGSGNETAAHINENGRMTIMFCSFQEKPLILRLYGKGEVVRKDSEKWSLYKKHFPDFYGERQIILLHIESVQSSCGYSVPFMEYVSEREQLNEHWAARSENEIMAYQTKKNLKSIDGIDTHLLD